MAGKSLISCERYDAAKVLEIEALGFKVLFDNCSFCGRKVMLSPETRLLLDAGCAPACSLCAEDLLAASASPQINITGGQIEELLRLTAAAAAKNN